MFSIHRESDGEQPAWIEVHDSKKTAFARIDLTRGASLQALSLSGIPLIQENPDFPYPDSYSSALLFPWVNRIEGGNYTFEGKTYQLSINLPKSEAAHHGLVYNQQFSLGKASCEAELAILQFGYDYQGQYSGYPFPFKFLLKYTFRPQKLTLSCSIQNTGSQTLPFTLGWHPYFLSQDLSQSTIQFQALGKLETNPLGIGRRLVEMQEEIHLPLKDVFLDDCYAIKASPLTFTTPAYHMEMQMHLPDAFLQLYTPPHKNLLAIEPMTGVSNSFNNGIGLQKLESGNSYSADWEMRIYKKQKRLNSSASTA